ncbi:hypothetical protein NQ317_011580 [Molorchus minor]|uniref:Uncharacterized protein n=1 Tax=Molorchus minor TaxID=1323400 RepID=A0ABQ9JDQ1_9CUCU|nr:hypothetical protein NQ317_011580 [Molorchus minor]
MYYALVQTHLSYGIIAWGGVADCYYKKLEVIQKWILKIIYSKCYTYDSDDLFKESGLMDTRQLFGVALILHQRKNIVSIEHLYSTRYKINKVFVPKMAKTVGDKLNLFILIFQIVDFNWRAVRARALTVIAY